MVSLISEFSASKTISDIFQLTQNSSRYTVRNGEIFSLGSSCWKKVNKTSQDLEAEARFLTEKVTLLSGVERFNLVEDAARIRELFFEALPTHAYERSAITPRSDLESLLDPERARLYDAIDLMDPVTGRGIDETISEALFSLRLGVKPEKRKGYCEVYFFKESYREVYFLKSREKVPLGVFKPHDKRPFYETRYGSAEDKEGHLAEVANSKLDSMLRTELVPYTSMLTCDLLLSDKFISKTGSFQFFVQEAPLLSSKLPQSCDLFDPDHEALSKRLDTPENQGLIFSNFEEMAFFDLFTGNNDHHFKNILVKELSQEESELVLIDNGNSFPWCHNLDLPFYKKHPLHWFKWSTLPQAKGKTFSPRMVEKINGLNFDEIEGMLREELVSSDVPSSRAHIDSKMRTLRDRYEVIKRLANEGATLREIAKAILALTEKTRGRVQVIHK